MKTFFEHVDTIKAQPHHVREKIAFGAAGVGAGIIGLVWFVGAFMSGSFFVAGTSFADSTGADNATVTAVAPKDTNYGVAGAAAAVRPSSSAPAHIEVIDAATTTSAPAPEQTVIPF